MRFTVTDAEGSPVEFECDDSLDSRMTCGAILEGRTYPDLPFIGDVGVVLDVGANCGAFSVHIARLHPEAVVHAFEPGSRARELLERNVAAYPGVVVHPVALAADDGELPLHLDATDIGQSSLHPPDGSSGPTELVTVRSAAGWVAEHGVERIDVLKVDVEGAEIEVLDGLAPLLPQVKVVYVEYDHRSHRRAIESLLGPSHELYFAMLMTLDQGECMWVRRDLAEHSDALGHLRSLWTSLIAPR
jgi:FkbM family methyltransferase